MKENNTADSINYVEEPIIAYIFDIEKRRMYPIIDTGNIGNYAIELPHIKSRAEDCHVIPAQKGDTLLVESGIPMGNIIIEHE